MIINPREMFKEKKPMHPDEERMREQNQERIENDFTYHQPQLGQLEVFAEIRDRAKYLALFLNNVCPQSRELSLALTHVEQAVMYANAAIARATPLTWHRIQHRLNVSSCCGLMLEPVAGLSVKVDDNLDQIVIRPPVSIFMVGHLSSILENASAEQMQAIRSEIHEIVEKWYGIIQREPMAE